MSTGDPAVAMTTPSCGLIKALSRKFIVSVEFTAAKTAAIPFIAVARNDACANKEIVLKSKSSHVTQTEIELVRKLSRRVGKVDGERERIVGVTVGELVICGCDGERVVAIEGRTVGTVVGAAVGARAQLLAEQLHSTVPGKYANSPHGQL